MCRASFLNCRVVYIRLAPRLLCAVQGTSVVEFFTLYRLHVCSVLCRARLFLLGDMTFSLCLLLTLHVLALVSFFCASGCQDGLQRKVVSLIWACSEYLSLAISEVF